MKTSFLAAAVAVLSLCMTCSVFAQSSRPAKRDRGPESAPSKEIREIKEVAKPEAVAPDMTNMDHEQMMAMMAAAVPADVTAWVARSEGNWTGEGWMMMEPGAPKTKMTSTDKATKVGTWNVVHTDMVGEDGMKMRGIAQTGYDFSKQAVVMTWIDDMTPSIWISEGQLEGPNKLVTSMSWKVPGGADIPHKMITEWKDNDHFSMTMTMENPEDGEWMEVMFWSYTRQK